ncbi:hypothetical protein AOLI_G00065760 [Acnodon oligacanthus]
MLLGDDVEFSKLKLKRNTTVPAEPKVYHLTTILSSVVEMTVQGSGCCSTIRENTLFDVALTPVTEFEENSRGGSEFLVGKLIVGQNDNAVEAVVSNTEQANSYV